MSRFSYKQGDLLHNTRTGLKVTVIRPEFTKRYMEAQDWEMESHGMGHMAGVYCGAITVICLSTGGQYDIRLRGSTRKEWRNLTAEAEDQAEVVA